MPPTKRKYDYVDSAGGMQSVDAESPEAAIAAAPNRSNSSGVSVSPGEPAQTVGAEPSQTTAPAAETPSPVRRTVRNYGLGGNPGASSDGVNSVENVQKELLRGAQGEINSLRELENTMLREQSVVNGQNERATSSVNTLTGLAGSSEANTAAARTSGESAASNKQIMAQSEAKIQNVMSQVRQDAVVEARARRGEAVQADETSYARAKENFTNLASSGVTYDGLKTADPEAFSYFADKFGGEEALRGAFILNTPQDQILDKQIVGGKYVIAKQNPVTGKVTTEVLDLGLPPQYTKLTDAGDRLVAIPEDWDGDTSKLISISKGLTPGQRQTASGAGTGGSEAYGNDLDAIVGSVLSTIPTKFGQATFNDQMSKARNDSDRINLVASQVLKGQPAEFKNDFRNQAVGISQIDKAIAAIDSGVKTGFLQDKAQYAFNVLGKDFDPKLAEIDGYITSAIQPYRNSVTGAAWGDQEEQEYTSLFGSTKFSPAELKQRLLQTKEILKSKSASGLNTFVNPLGLYDNAFETGSYAPSGSKVLVGPDGNAFDASDLTLSEYEEAIRDGYKPQ